MLQELRLQHAGGGEAEKHVGAGNDIGQRARLGVLHIRVFPAIHLLDAALMGDAEAVRDPDVFHLGAERDQKVEAGEGRSTRAGGDDLYV